MTTSGDPAGSPAEGPRSEALCREVRRSPVIRQLVPMEAGIGWPLPVPVVQDGTPRVYVRLPLFVMRPDPAGGADLFPPFATATVDWSTRRLVEYTDLRFKEPHRSRAEWSRPVGRFPHPAVAGLTTNAYRDLRTRLLTLYDELLDELAHGRQPGGGARPGEFGGLLTRLLEPALVPHYRRLAPKFLGRYLPDPHRPDER
ncbi:hypothetical protein F9278_37855 [Streptomyces phaeolivaceus]|uniref:Uncharacterized protein n=1 Tax=Streptomyces phaeolivaceus TaxID=2653200 RepID=A0A5P8KDA8_9ACTN|nr:hypothetical protein [Streptomyces phaeolivaceus]QFR00995.1 hypothetical protein F9278_37855 [Streptomyces phaeolivaceus]